MTIAAASGKTDFICTKMNLRNYPDVQKLHPMPFTGTSAQVNTNVSNIQKKRRHSEQPATTIWVTIFPTNMVLRVNIDQIEPATRDWICKVQIVEIGRPRESLDKKCTFQNLILEDEEVRSLFYFMNAKLKVICTMKLIGMHWRLKLFHTYLIFTARVKVSPASYGKPIHKFYWILDKETVIEEIKPSHEVEKPLPPPTKLNITNFDRIPHLMVDSAAEIDILAIVLRCGPQKNAGWSHHRCREITLCDNHSSTAPMIVTTGGANNFSIAEISSAPYMGVLYVEAEMAILDEFQDFCVLECSGCKQKKRTKDRKDFHCPKCNRKTALVPRCSFQIDLIDISLLQPRIYLSELGEKYIHDSEDIFDTTCTKLRKSSWASSNTTHATLSILSYTEKQHAPQTTTDRTSKKIKPLEIRTPSNRFVTFAYDRDNIMNDSPYALLYFTRKLTYGQANCSTL
ncbi:hypothetical protein H5410_064221 [Solanum commersonii]|uniref:Replication factor A C-terminal domain-containing protein n=1 Tax=Solanum commersonii TaxID=4109 RepID=A0A9J5W096_SOLCO|nr:hypothetical protein H5410_064221 [Solanum commersonii]